jgi:hypothetical protein
MRVEEDDGAEWTGEEDSGGGFGRMSEDEGARAGREWTKPGRRVEVRDRM